MWYGTTGDDDPGRLIAGRYRLLELIGRGGMGTVWQAEDEVLGRHVAVKKLQLSPTLEDAERATRFERTRREARSAARIAHPNVVVVHDVVDDDGLPCIIMEHVRAPALDEVLGTSGPLPVGEVARIGAGMVAALRAAHAAGVLHRDVKPGNVLLGADGRVVLTDFGIAVVTDTTTLTRTGELVGSMDFCSPERLRGADPAPASDLWALGATLYQAVHGRPPFRRDTPFETAYAIAFEDLEQPAGAGALTPLIEELLAKDPEGRPSVQEVERRLQAVVDTARMEDVHLLGQERESGQGQGQEPGYGSESVTKASPASRTATAGTLAAGAGHAGDAGGDGGVIPAGDPGGRDDPDGRGDTGGGRGRGRRVAVWTVAAVVAAALALGGGYLWLGNSGTDGHASAQGNEPSGDGKRPTGDKPSGAAKPSPGGKNPANLGPAVVPQGYRLAREEQFGVSLPVPEGWKRTQLAEDNEGVAYVDPTGKVSLRISALDFASTDPLRRWQNDEKNSIQEGKLPGYRQIRMQRTTYQGMRAAIWEFTWQGRARQFQARDLGFGKPGGKEYAIYLSAPSADWDRYEGIFNDVRKGFRIRERDGEEGGTGDGTGAG